MKRSRIGIRRRQRKITIGIALFFLVVLPVAAVAIGQRITEWVVVPTINMDDILNSTTDTALETEDTEENNSEQAEETSSKEVETETNTKAHTEATNISSLSVHMVQIASVSDHKNIEPLVNELKNHKFPHIIYKIDNTYKVYTFGSTQREYIEDRLDLVREVYPDAYIGQMHIPEKKVNYSSVENDGTKEIAAHMNLMIDLLDQSSNMIYNVNVSEEGLDQYKEVLVEHQKLLGKISEKIEDSVVAQEFANTEDLKKMVEYQEKNIIESLKIIEESKDLYQLQNYLIDSLFRTIEVVKK